MGKWGGVAYGVAGFSVVVFWVNFHTFGPYFLDMFQSQAPVSTGNRLAL